MSIATGFDTADLKDAKALLAQPNEVIVENRCFSPLYDATPSPF